MIYVPWNLLFCYKINDFEHGLYHNITLIIVSLFYNNMFIKWFHIRCLCVVVSILCSIKKIKYILNNVKRINTY